jgi:predicted ribosomally synthesized peptide with SipW-like signal peptide
LTIVALGVATAGIVSGSYAAWTAQTANPGNQVAAGTLTMSNDKDATSVFTASNVKPGDTGSSTVTVQNTGSLPMAVALTQDQMSSTGIEASLGINIHDDTRNWCVWPVSQAGACPAGYGAWDATATLAGSSLPATDGSAKWPAGQSHTFTISWQLAASSPNSDQGKTGSFRLVWDGTQ